MLASIWSTIIQLYWKKAETFFHFYFLICSIFIYMNNSTNTIISDMSDNWKLYMIVGISAFYIMVKAKISLTKILYVIIIIAIIYIVNGYNGKNHKKIQNNKKEKHIEDLFPQYIKPNDLYKSDDVTNFLFITKDFSKYNKKSYKEVVDSIISIDHILKNVKIYDEFCEQKYESAFDERQEAINSFHSLIHSIPSDKNYDKKFKSSIIILVTILESYLNEIKKICENKLEIDGYSVNRKIIKHRNAPQEANAFDDHNDHTFYVY
jgi:hypothetical protein